MRGQPGAVDNAPLIFVRLLYGATMLWEIGRLYAYGWIDRYYVLPTFHFTYYGFGWVEPLGRPGMYVVFASLAVCALLILLGLYYRVAAAAFFLLYLYVFLVEQARFQNHFYLLVLLALLLAIVPAHRGLSLDARRRPALRSALAPAWSLWLLRLQIGIVYVYGGIAKCNADWLRGEPMRTFLERRSGDPVAAWILAHDALVHVMSWGGLLFDLAIVPALMWKKSRPFAVAALLLFHVTNSRIFHIGVFPWFMLAATPIFFEPEWLRRVLRLRPAAPGGAPVAKPAPALVAFLAAFVALQALVPLRHYVQPGNVLWIEHGRLFSWHMKLHAKRVEGEFVIVDPARGAAHVDPYRILPGWQAERMLATPDMMVQFARRLRDEAARQGSPGVRVHARVRASLHGRHAQWLVDPETDLAAEPRTLWPPAWIVDLEEPLPPRRAGRSVAELEH